MSKNKDPYTYPGTSVLINKFDIRDKTKLDRIETKFSAVRLTTVKDVSGKFDYQHLKDIHKHLFKDIYDFAGKPRTIGISKAEPVLNRKTVEYPHPNDPFPPNNLEARNKYAFDELKKDNHLKGLDSKTFTEKLTNHATEIWENHSFREGNTRTVVAFMMQLSKNAKHELKGNVYENPRVVRDAFVLAVSGNKIPLKEIITKAMNEKKTLDYDHLKTENPNAYQKISLVRNAAKQYAEKITTDKDSQEALADQIGNKTYAHYRSGNKIPEVSKIKKPSKDNDISR